MNYRLVPDERLQATLGGLALGARAEIEHAGAYALSVLVRRHVNAYARSHHGTANALGAQPTRHMESGSAAITCEGSTVSVPIPGYGRAFHDVEVTPRRAKALTIPISRVAYGVRAGRLASEGWDLFTVRTRGGGPGSGILFGRRAGEDNAVALYLLRARAHQRQDRSMMPGDEEMRRQSAAAVARAILRRSA